MNEPKQININITMPRWLLPALGYIVVISAVFSGGYASGYHKAYVDKDRTINAIADATGITPNPFDPPQQ